MGLLFSLVPHADDGRGATPSGTAISRASPRLASPVGPKMAAGDSWMGFKSLFALGLYLRGALGWVNTSEAIVTVRNSGGRVGGGGRVEDRSLARDTVRRRLLWRLWWRLSWRLW